jgi:hypothetical protein
MWARYALTVASLALFVGCAGSGAARASSASKRDVDQDPVALLPPSAIFVASVDARAIRGNQSIGPLLAKELTDLVPLGDAARFNPSTDVDRIVVGGYGAADATDVVAVLQGRFDTSAIASTTQTRSGRAIVHDHYAGFDTLTVDPAVYAPLTPRTFVAGTVTSVRSVLQRASDRNAGRALPPWVGETLDTSGAKLALAVDMASPAASSTISGIVSVPWIQGLRVARVVADLEPPGMNVAATLSYADAPQAQTAAEGVRLLDRWLKVVAPLVGGVRLQNLDVQPKENDLHCTFALDDQALHALASLAPRFLPARPQ